MVSSWGPYFYNASHLCIPIVIAPISSPPKQFTPIIHHIINKVNTLWHQYHQWLTAYLHRKLNHSESFLWDLLSSTKADYLHCLISSYHSTPNNLFIYLKNLSKSASSNYPIYYESKPTTNPQKAELFNCYFNSVLTVSDFILPPSDQQPTPIKQLNQITIYPSDVYDALVALNTANAARPDDISPIVLKLCADSLILPLTHLLNPCMQSCSIHDE